MEPSNQTRLIKFFFEESPSATLKFDALFLFLCCLWWNITFQLKEPRCSGGRKCFFFLNNLKCLRLSQSWSLITEHFHWLELAARSWSIIRRLVQSKTKQWLLGAAREGGILHLHPGFFTHLLLDEMDQWILDGFSSNLGGDFQRFWKDGSPVKCNYPRVQQ